MNFRLTLKFEKKVKKLCRKDPTLRRALAKQFLIFAGNPHHPSLRIHKLQGKRSFQHAIWISGDLRALCIQDGDLYIFLDLITHDEY